MRLSSSGYAQRSVPPGRPRARVPRRARPHEPFGVARLEVCARLRPRRSNQAVARTDSAIPPMPDPLSNTRFRLVRIPGGQSKARLG